MQKMEGDILHSLLTEEFLKHRFEVRMKLVEIYAALLTTNAEIEIERGFSCMKKIKTGSLNEEDINLSRYNHWNFT